MTGYTCIDFETTGLFPKREDRVVEVGVVFVDEEGAVEGEWSTLVNPGGEVGPTHIHGITAEEVLEAPSFTDIAPIILRSVAGRTVVCHNARFDTRFLRIELARAGYSWTGPRIPAVCTMELGYRYVPGTARKLADCCRVAKVPQADAHEALADARAVAGLLAHLMSVTSKPAPWTALHEECREYAWPVCEDMGDVRFVHRTSTTPRRPKLWLDRIVATMPRHADIRVDSYLEVLESALLDRYLSLDEEEALIETAVDLGLDRDRLDAIHRDYLLSMAGVAWEDGVITKAELAELNTVARLLGLYQDDVALSLDAAKAAQRGPVGSTFQLAPGDLICLDEQLQHPRETIESLLLERGLEVGELTRQTRLLVASAADSRLATSARGYDVPIVAETELLGLLLGMPDADPDG
jgi:DNA polymerase-3 subunit epsilon